jgi:hypothetical protein
MSEWQDAGDPVDLSISVRGGEEANEDSCSSGERRGRSPGGKRSVVGVVWKQDGKPVPWRVRAPWTCWRRVGLFGSAGRMWVDMASKAKYSV